MSPPEPMAAEPMDAVLAQLRRLAASDDPSARTAAAHRLAELLHHEFDVVFDATQEWALDADPHVRTAALLACDQTPDEGDEVQVRRLLGRVEMFIGDPDDGINDLWSRTVVPTLLAARPEVVLPWLRDWTKNDDARARAGIARAFGHVGQRYPTEAVEGLALIGIDPRADVRDAVVASLDEIREKYPGMGAYLDNRFAALFGE